MALIEAFVRNPVKVAVGVLLVLLFGLIALLRMPMQLAPEVQHPKISIETRWPGASPQEIEREIIQQQEDPLQGVEGVTKMSAECSDSRGAITLEFAVGTNMSEALLRVDSRLRQVPEYPEEADEPVITTSSSSDQFMALFILRPRTASLAEIAAFLSRPQNVDLRQLLEPVERAQNAALAAYRLRKLVEQHPEIEERVEELLPPNLQVFKFREFAEDFIEARFQRVPGVADANVFGGREREMQVIVDPQRLAAHGLTMMDLRRALRQENRDVSAGDLREGKRRYVVRTLGRFSTEQQVAEVIVAHGDDGAPLQVRDVADVRLGYKKPPGIVRNFGTECLTVGCRRKVGANVLDTMERIRQIAAELNRGVLKERGLELVLMYDESDYVYSAIGLVDWNMVIGGLLTVAVLLVFLRSGRSTIVIALAIPTSIIGTFLMLDLMGRSLNVISLAGLAFAVGMLVDNAVVVLENIFRHYQAGEDPFLAAVGGTKEVWGAVVASTLTTLAVFLPVLFVEEEAGQLFRDIALAISSAVGLSLIVSVTVIPTAASRILRRRGEPTPPEGRPPARSRLQPLDTLAQFVVHRVVAINAVLQRSILLRLAIVVLFVGGSLGISWLMMPSVEYLPAGNRNSVIGTFQPPAGYDIERLLELGKKLEQDTKPYWDVDKGDPANERLDFPPLENYFVFPTKDRLYFGVRAVDPMRAGELVPLVQKLGAQFPGMITFASQQSVFSFGLSGGRIVDVEITGPDLPKLVELGRRIFGQGERPEDQRLDVHQVVPGCLAFPSPSLDLSTPELHLVRKLEQAAEMGISTEELGYTVDALIDGAYATDYYLAGNKIDLTLIGGGQFVEYTQDVPGLIINTPSGKLARLESLADVRLAGGPEQINRRERQRAITISVVPPREMPLERAVDLIDIQIIEPLRESGEIGGAYQIRLSGTADKLRTTWRALKWNFLLALLITYLLMAALFESWLYPLVIILSVPLGAVGGFLGLTALNWYLSLQPHSTPQSLDVLTMLGFVILIGTVVNNPILIVHQSLNHMRDDGMRPGDAILASVRTRIRPIFMTTATTVLGLSPLVLLPGQGSELYRGLGAVVLGGLVVSTLFTLVLVPTLFSLMMEARAGLLRWTPETGQPDKV